MLNKNKSQPLIKFKQVEPPKMQSIFHYRKQNREKNQKLVSGIDLEEPLLNETVENEVEEEKPEKISLEIIEPFTNQPTRFTLFDLTQNPDELMKNLMDSITNPESNFSLDSLFKSDDIIDIDMETVELDPYENQNMYESISILEMAQEVMQDLFTQHLKRSSGTNHSLNKLPIIENDPEEVSFLEDE